MEKKYAKVHFTRGKLDAQGIDRMTIEVTVYRTLSTLGHTATAYRFIAKDADKSCESMFGPSHMLTIENATLSFDGDTLSIKGFVVVESPSPCQLNSRLMYVEAEINILDQ